MSEALMGLLHTPLHNGLPLNPEELVLHPVYAIVYEKASFDEPTFSSSALPSPFFWASETTKPADFFFEVTTRMSWLRGGGGCVKPS